MRWIYEAGADRIVFDGAAMPPIGSTVLISYAPQCAS